MGNCILCVKKIGFFTASHHISEGDICGKCWNKLEKYCNLYNKTPQCYSTEQLQTILSYSDSLDIYVEQINEIEYECQKKIEYYNHEIDDCKRNIRKCEKDLKEIKRDYDTDLKEYEREKIKDDYENKREGIPTLKELQQEYVRCQKSGKTLEASNLAALISKIEADDKQTKQDMKNIYEKYKKIDSYTIEASNELIKGYTQSIDATNLICGVQKLIVQLYDVPSENSVCGGEKGTIDLQKEDTQINVAWKLLNLYCCDIKKNINELNCIDKLNSVSIRKIFSKEILEAYIEYLQNMRIGFVVLAQINEREKYIKGAKLRCGEQKLQNDEIYQEDIKALNSLNRKFDEISETINKNMNNIISRMPKWKELKQFSLCSEKLENDVIKNKENNYQPKKTDTETVKENVPCSATNFYEKIVQSVLAAHPISDAGIMCEAGMPLREQIKVEAMKIAFGIPNEDIIYFAASGNIMSGFKKNSKGFAITSHGIFFNDDDKKMGKFSFEEFTNVKLGKSMGYLKMENSEFNICSTAKVLEMLNILQNEIAKNA